MESRRTFIAGLTGTALGAAAGAGVSGSLTAQLPPPSEPGQALLAAGLTGDGSADDLPALARQLDRASATGGATLVLPPGVYRMGGDLRIPPGVTLGFAHGATLSGEGRVQVEGGIQAGLHPIFRGVQVRFAPGRVTWVYPQWWGALGDGVHDDTEALQAAIRASNVVLPAGQYRTTRELHIGNRTTIVGVGNSWSPTPTTDSWIQYDGPENPRVAVVRVAAAAVGADPADAVSSVHLERIVLNGGGRAGYGLYSVYCTNDSSFSDITVRQCTQHGFFISQQWYSSYRNLVARNNDGCGITIGAVFEGWNDRGVNGIVFDNIRAAENGGDRQFDEVLRPRWGYGVLFRPGAGTAIRHVVSEGNDGPGLIYDLGPRPATRIEGAYLEGNGVAAHRRGATRAWGLVVIGHPNARANRVSSVYLRGEVGASGAQSVWLTGDAPTGEVVLEDLSYGHHLHAGWPQYRFQGYIYPGLAGYITGREPGSRGS